MAITYQGAGAATVNSGSATTIDVAYPASPLIGDTLVLVVTTNSITGPTTPSGWTSGSASNASGSTPAYRAMYKTALGGESGNLTVTIPGVSAHGIMLLFRGVDQSVIVDVAGTTYANSSAATAFNIPTLTTTMTGVTLVYAGAATGTTGTWTPPTVPASFTEVYDANSSTPVSTAGYLIWSGSGATGTINLVRSSSTRGAAGVIALRPAPAGALYATASIAAVATVTASGAVSVNTTATATETVTVTTGGVVGAVAAASISATATVTASGAVSTSTTASLAGVATVTAAGMVAEFASAALAALDAITATGQVSAYSSASLTGTAAITCSGAVGASSSASIAAVVAVTTAGSAGFAGTASIDATASVTITGAYGLGGSAAIAALATLVATGRLHAIADAHRLRTVPTETRTVTVPAELRQMEVS